MALKRDVGILDDCAALSLRKRKSLIARYRNSERMPRILSFSAAACAMLAALLMAVGAQPIAEWTEFHSVIAALLAIFASLLAVSSAMFGSAIQMADILDGASSFLSLSNRCQIERERGVAVGNVTQDALREIIGEFNTLSQRYDRMLPLAVGSLSLARATDLPDITPVRAIEPQPEQGDMMLNQIDQLIDNIKSTDFSLGEDLSADLPDDLIDTGKKADQLSTEKSRSTPWEKVLSKSSGRPRPKNTGVLTSTPAAKGETSSRS